MILLFPGSFKPFHDGHFLLLKRYIEEFAPEKVYIIISSKKRSGIKPAISKSFIKKVFNDTWNDIEFIIKISPKKVNPINYCYKIIGNDKNSDHEYIMINSGKDNDSRVEDFYELFKKGGDYYHNGAYAVNPDIETEPLYYEDRDDEYSDSPISSAIVRNDIVNDNFKMFKTSYSNILNETYITIEDLEEYFEDLEECIDQDEDDMDKLTRYLKESILNEVLLSWNDIDNSLEDTGIINKSDIYNKIRVKDPEELKNGGYKRLTIDMVDSEFADIDPKMMCKPYTTKRFYNRDGSPTNWFAWWMALCIYGPMSRPELLRYCELPEGSYPQQWGIMASEGMVRYDNSRRKYDPIPMSQWYIWNF